MPQGNPLSPLIFNVVMNYLIKRLRCKWGPAKCGIKLSEGNYMDIFDFADDFVLFSTTRLGLQQMVDDLCVELDSFGLILDASKCEWSHNIVVNL